MSQTGTAENWPEFSLLRSITDQLLACSAQPNNVLEMGNWRRILLSLNTGLLTCQSRKTCSLNLSFNQIKWRINKRIHDSFFNSCAGQIRYFKSVILQRQSKQYNSIPTSIYPLHWLHSFFLIQLIFNSVAPHSREENISMWKSRQNTGGRELEKEGSDSNKCWQVSSVLWWNVTNENKPERKREWGRGGWSRP